MTYREQAYVDRCYCDEPATAHCRMCNRPRCARHVEADQLCHRCVEALEVELTPRADARMFGTAAVGSGITIVSLIAHVPMFGVPVAAVAAAATYVASRVLGRRAAMKRLAPRLAATTGEVKPERTDEREVGNGPAYDYSRYVR
jgi:hypothetical protein